MRTLCAGLLVLVLAVAGCGGDDGAGGSAEDATPTQQATTEAAGGEQTAAAGKAVFTANCAGCHTLADARADGQVGPNLDELKPDEAETERQVTNGGGRMPAFKDRLSTEEIQSVAAYVSSVAGK